MKKIAVVVVVALALCLPGCFSTEPPKPDPCTDGYDALDFETRMDCARARHNSALDGHHWRAVDALKSRLNDPDSLKVEFTQILVGNTSREDQTYNVVIKFRAKNGFGAMRMAYATAVCDLKTGDVQDLKINE